MEFDATVLRVILGLLGIILLCVAVRHENTQASFIFISPKKTRLSESIRRGVLIQLEDDTVRRIRWYLPLPHGFLVAVNRKFPRIENRDPVIVQEPA